MLKLPIWMIAILGEFAPVIYGVSTWYKVEVLVVGAILTSGKRTVSAALRVMGLGQEKNYAKYHHVLNRAVWTYPDLTDTQKVRGVQAAQKHKG